MVNRILPHVSGGAILIDSWGDQWVALSAAADCLRTSTSSLIRWIATGKLTGRQVAGRWWYVRAEEVARYLTDRREE